MSASVVPWCALAALTLSPMAGSAQESEGRPAPPVRHTLEWRENCLMCHREGALDVVPDIPVDHRDRARRTCLWCHAGEAAMQGGRAGVVPHEIARRSQCLLCHAPARIPAAPDVPGDHEGRTDADCTLCHRPGGAG